MEIVYFETSFFSFYFDDRTAPAIVAMREWTRQFWDERGDKYSFVTGEGGFGRCAPELKRNALHAEMK